MADAAQVRTLCGFEHKFNLGFALSLEHFCADRLDSYYSVLLSVKCEKFSSDAD